VKNLFGIQKNQQIIFRDHATREQIADFIGKTGPGPDKDQPMWDMGGSSKSYWNAEVIEIVLEEVKDYFEPADDFASDEYLRDLIEKKFQRLKHHYNQALPRCNADGLLKTDQDVQSRIVQGGVEVEKTKRQQSRKYRVSDIEDLIIFDSQVHS
jgi:hypothetical protein